MAGETPGAGKRRGLYGTRAQGRSSGKTFAMHHAVGSPIEESARRRWSRVPLKQLDRATEQLLDVRHRDIRLVTTLVTAALAGGMALLWPAVQDRVIERFGPYFSSRFLLGELLLLVALYLIHLWRKAGRIERLVRQLLSERDRGAALEERLQQARAVLQASAQLEIDGDAGASLRSILRCVTEALQARRGVLWRQRADGRPPEREAVFPSATAAADPLLLAFEDEIARAVLASGATLRIDEATNLAQIGIAAVRPRGVAARLVAAPLLLDRKPVGVLLLSDSAAETTGETSPLELLEVFAGFAAGVLRNLRLYQAIARRNDELLRARQLLCDHQRELAEIDAVATMGRVAKSLAHGLSGPLTAISGFVDVAMTSAGDALTLKSAREGLRRETHELKTRLQAVVNFTETWRREYGPVDLNRIVETAVALQAEPLRARGIALRYDAHAGLPWTVADATRLRQAMLSLLTFLRDAVREGPGRDIRVRTVPDAGVLRVQFDFPGRADLARLTAPLLDPNVDLRLLQSEHHVDLPVAVAIVREHRGDVALQTREDGGTRLALELPILDRAPVEITDAPDPDDSVEALLERLWGDGAGTKSPAAAAPSREQTPPSAPPTAAPTAAAAPATVAVAA
ncbi:MAG: GAF domain-containing protein, partial [Planctomycetes bacterium]|nr:GAF domain-containing protein [Planctomycetota bacterium]